MTMIPFLGHRGLEWVKDRMRVNKLNLNSNKMEVLVGGPNSVLGIDCTLILDGVILSCTDLQSGCTPVPTSPARSSREGSGLGCIVPASLGMPAVPLLLLVKCT